MDKKQSRGALITLVLVSMLNVMGGAAIAPALPAISETFPHASETMVSLIITLPSLAVAISGFFVGVIADRIGKERTLVASLILFTVTGLSGLVLPTLELILIVRFIMGIGIAGIATASGALVSEYFDSDLRAKMYGWQSAASGISVLVLETSGGFLSLISWRAPFVVYTVGLVLLGMAILYILPRASAQPNLSDTGHPSPTVSPNASTLQPEASATVHSITYVLGICLAVAFISQTLSYLVPAKMPYLVDSLGASSAITGLFLGGFGIANIAGSLASAPLQKQVDRPIITVACFALLSAGCFTMGMASNAALVLLGAALMGLGVGCVTPVHMNWLASRSTPLNSGKHMGAFATACNLGQFSCSLLSGVVLALAHTHQAVFFTGAAIGLAAAVVFFIGQKYTK